MGAARSVTPASHPAAARGRPARPSFVAILRPREKLAATLASPVAWLLLFLIVPVVLVAIVGFASIGPTYLPEFDRPTLANYAQVFDPTGIPMQLLARSITLAVAATLLSLAIGYGMAYYIARMAAERWRGVLMALVVIPFWITFVVRIYGLILFVRPEGYIDLTFRGLGIPDAGQWFRENFGLGTDALLLFTLVYVWLPFMVLPLFTSLGKIDQQLLEAAYDLGASRLRAFWNVTLPLSMPGIVTGSIFIFITTLGSFVEPDFIAADPMVGNFVYTQFQIAGNITLGAAASVFMIISTMVLVTFYARYAELEAGGVFARTRPPSRWKALARSSLLGVGASILGIVAALLLVSALASGSAGGILDGLLVGAIALPALAYAAGEVAGAVRGEPAFRVEAARGLALFLFAAALWVVGRAALAAFAIGAGGLDAEAVFIAGLIGIVAGFGFLAAANGGLIVLRNPDTFARRPLSESVRLFTEGLHPLATLTMATTRFLDRIAERWGRHLLAGLTAFVLIVFFAPLILMAVFSFTAGQNPSAWEGFSLRWYIGGGGGVVERAALFTSPETMGSLATSVIVGFFSALLSLVFGLMAAFAIDRYAFRGKSALNHAMYLGLVIPSIVLGIALSILVRVLNQGLLDPLGAEWRFGTLALIVGHTTFNIPLATLVLLISFREFDRSLEEAAMNLGAGPLKTFFLVTLPNIKGGIMSALLLTFTFSFDEYPVSIFLAGENPTFPIVVWGFYARRIPTPIINAASTLILVISVAFVLLANKVQKGGAIFRI